MPVEAPIAFEPIKDDSIQFETLGGASAAHIDFEPLAPEPNNEPVDTNPVPDLSDPAAAATFFEPLVNVPPKLVEAAIATSPVGALLPDEVRRGVAKGVADTVSGLTSPESIVLGATALAQPQIAAGIFSGLAAKEAGTQLGEASVAAQQGQTELAAEQATRGVAQAGMAVVAGTAPVLFRERAAPSREAPPVSEGAPPLAKELGFEPLESAPAAPLEAPLTPEPLPTASASAEAKLGILPPGAAEGAQIVRDSAAKLDQTRAGFAREFTVSDVKSDIVRKLDAADNEARIEGQQIGNRVRLDLPDALDRDAVTFIVEANGDRGALDVMLEKVEGKSAAAAEAIKHAQANWDRLSPAAERVSALHEEQLTYEQANGIDPGEVEGYVRHAYDMDAMIGKGRPVLLSNPRGGAGVSTSFKKQRTFATYADAIEAGFKPRTFDIADLVQSRIALGERLVNRTQWAHSFGNVMDPVEGQPIVRPLVTQQPKGTQVAPIGYVQQELMPGIRVAVHEGYADLFGALLGRSAVTASAVGRTLLKGEAIVKHGLLAVDTFHAGRMLYKELALTGKLGHDLGRSLLEYADKDLEAAVKAGEITQEAADWARANRADAELLTGQGLNVGRVSDALYKDFANNIPVWGKVVTPTTRWIFDKLTRGAMLHSGIAELNRLRAAKPGIADAEAAAIVAKNLNAYYGNLGRQGWVKSATFQDLARIIALAPQWVEGMARTEAGAAKQLAQAPVDVLRGRGLTLGPLAKGVGTGVLATFIANQLVNLVTRGHPTWENPEHGHQLDAWIPNIGSEGPGFFLNPLSVFAELTHDAMRYYEDDPHALKVVSRIIGNKLSPLAHAEEVLRTGKDWQGRQLDSTWERFKEAGKTLMPVPIPLQGALRQNSPPGAFQRQLFGSAGIKIEPAPTADSQLYNLARRFKEAQGIKQEPAQPSEYRNLNNALRKGDFEEARDAYKALLDEGKTVKVVRDHYRELPRQLYTGKRSTEAAFKASLNEDQQVLLEKAREERDQIRSRFYEMLGMTEE